MKKTSFAGKNGGPEVAMLWAHHEKASLLEKTIMLGWKAAGKEKDQI